MAGFDLHIHTTASDGTMSGKEIIRAAIDIGLEGIAITDHDTVSGLEEAVQLGKELNFPVIPGIELSTEFEQREIHILGYFIKYHLSWVREKLIDLQNARIKRISKMVAKLNNLGYDINEEEVFHHAGNGSVGRPHIAHILKEKGYSLTVQDAFRQLIGKDCPAYVERFKLTPLEAAAFITNAGGIPVLAHPGLSQSDGLIPLLCDYGLKGIEVYHPDHTMADESKYLLMAREHRLMITGGSDFHGSSRSALGSKSVSAKIWHEMRAYLGTCHDD